MHYGDNIPRPVKKKFGDERESGEECVTGRQGQDKGTGWNFSFCFSLSNLKRLFSHLLFHFELISHSDLDQAL
jgi:hypothetical protein